MAFAPVEQLIAQIAAGRMVVIVDDEDRENEGDLVMAAQHVRAEDVNFMAREGRGLICLAMTTERCDRLGLPPMVASNRSRFGTAFTVSIEAARGISTGISAADRALTIQAAVASDATARDLTQPGHVFPLRAQPGGVLARAGHTEAACDLAGLAGLEPAGVIVEILSADGSMARRPELETFAKAQGLAIGTIADLIAHRLATEHTVEPVFDGDVETDFGPFRLRSFRDVLSGQLHHALIRGEVDADRPTLVRVHVSDPLSDLLHLRRADLGIPLVAAMAEIAAEPNGVVLVLDDGGDGDRVLARLRQDSVTDHAAVEWRRNGTGAQILAALGCRELVVIGRERRYKGLSGFGLSVVEHRDPAL